MVSTEAFTWSIKKILKKFYTLASKEIVCVVKKQLKPVENRQNLIGSKSG